MKAYSLSPIFLCGPTGVDIALIFSLISMILINFSQSRFELQGANGI